jgi:hypothetical protein
MAPQSLQAKKLPKNRPFRGDEETLYLGISAKQIQQKRLGMESRKRKRHFSAP